MNSTMKNVPEICEYSNPISIGYECNMKYMKCMCRLGRFTRLTYLFKT